MYPTRTYGRNSLSLSLKLPEDDADTGDEDPHLDGQPPRADTVLR